MLMTKLLWDHGFWLSSFLLCVDQVGISLASGVWLTGVVISINRYTSPLNLHLSAVWNIFSCSLSLLRCYYRKGLFTKRYTLCWDKDCVYRMCMISKPWCESEGWDKNPLCVHMGKAGVIAGVCACVCLSSCSHSHKDMLRLGLHYSSNPLQQKNEHLSGLRSQRSNKMVILLTHFTLFVCLVYSIRPHGTWIAWIMKMFWIRYFF